MTMTPMRIGVLGFGLVSALIAGGASSHLSRADQVRADAESKPSGETPADGKGLRVHYLEIVTPNVNETCEALSKTHGSPFGKPVPELGHARTAELVGGGRIGVRAPLRATEAPVVRPYVLVSDIEAALKVAEAAGGQAAMTPMEIPGQGKLAIYVLGGIDHGLWQLMNARP